MGSSLAKNILLSLVLLRESLDFKHKLIKHRSGASAQRVVQWDLVVVNAQEPA